MFPAHAGVILPEPIQATTGTGVPRTRGGDPDRLETKVVEPKCSPHTRG